MAKKKNQEQEIVTNQSVDEKATDEVTNKPKRKVKASTIVTTSIVVTVAIAAGLATGIIFGKLFSTGDVELPPIEEGVEMDYDALLARYAEDSNPESYKPHELANISWNLLPRRKIHIPLVVEKPTLQSWINSPILTTSEEETTGTPNQYLLTKVALR